MKRTRSTSSSVAKRPKHPAEQYIFDVLRGRIIVGKLVRRAVERHVADLKHGRKRGLRFDRDKAQHAIDFFGFLRHSKGEWAGQPIKLESWQMFLLWVLFGWVRADGRRRFRTAYIEVARKNGKSTLMAGIGLYLFFADGEPGAEVYTAATKRDQARIVHGESIRMVRASAGLRQRIQIYKDNLHIPGTASKYEPLGADSDTMDGLNVHAGIVDEFHAHKSRAVWDVLDTATGSRRQPMLAAITTAGFEQESICKENRDYAVNLLEGFQKDDFVDDTFFGLIYTTDEKDDWQDEKNWPKANPNLGVSVKLDDLRRKAEKAKKIPTARNNFLCKHLNVWTSQVMAFIPVEAWDACFEEFDEALLLGRACIGGLDLASKLDISAFVLLFLPTEADPYYRVKCYFWMPEDRVEEHERSDHVPYRTWIDEGMITTTEGDIVDYNVIEEEIKALSEKYKIQEIAFDPYYATQLQTNLGDFGLTMIEFPQTIKHLGHPTKELEALVVAKVLRHDGNKVERWMLGNVAIRKDVNNSWRPDKKKSSKRIDGISALIDALGRAIVLPDASSVYDGRGLITL